MSQCSLFGVESYKTTRKPVRGNACARGQFDMFRAVAKTDEPVKAKRGQRFIVEKTGMVVTFIRQIGSSSLWECDGIVWRATGRQVAEGRVRPLH